MRGIDVILHVKTASGTDEFNRTEYTDKTKTVSNVLVVPTSEQEVLDILNLTGKKAIYTLCIPKGNTDTWTDTEVEFFGQTWRTIGMPIQWIEDLVPLQWNMKVRVERVEL